MNDDSPDRLRAFQSSIAALLLVMLTFWLLFAISKAVHERLNATRHDHRSGGKPWQLTEWSANRRYRFEAKGITGDSYYFRHAIDVRYTLYRDHTSEPLWRQALPPDEIIPFSAFVHNKGWVVTRDAYQLTVIAPDGKVSFQRSIEGDVIPLEDLNAYARFTDTRGLHWWSGRSHWYFVDLDDNPYFCIRPWWGHRVAIDLEAGRTVKVDAALRQAAEEAEKQLVMATLSEAVAGAANSDPLSDTGKEMLRRAADAAHLAGCTKLKEAIPLLKKLEAVPLQETWKITGEEFLGATPTAIGISPFTYGTFELRQMVQLALRRLGENPAGYAATSFELRQGNSKHNVFEPTAKFTARERSVGLLKRGMRPIGVLKALGPPDYVTGESWHYDIDALSSYTLIISWTDRRVAKVDRQTPPLWETVGHTRIEGLSLP